MKLNLNAEELLALHNLLRDTLDITGDRAKDPLTVDSARLRQVYNRVKAQFVAALSGRSGDQLDAVMSPGQSKADRLKYTLDDVKKEHSGLGDALKDKDYIVPGRDDDLEVPDYPKRSRRSGGGGRNQKR